MLRSIYSPAAVIPLALATVGLCVSTSIHVVRAQEARQRPYLPSGGDRPDRPNVGPTTVHHHYYYGHANYAAGYGSGSGLQGADLSGFTNPAAARGQYNLDTSQAAINLTQARSQSIENHNYAVSSYYQNKNIHDQYMAEQAAKTRLSEGEAEQIAQEATPGRLTSAQLDRANGIIHWPPFLRDKAFSDVRFKLDQAYHVRTPDNSGADSDNYIEIKKDCDAMHDILKGMINDVPPATYIAASHFIRSLSYEGQFAAK
jgi:hypothetical protein